MKVIEDGHYAMFCGGCGRLIPEEDFIKFQLGCIKFLICPECAKDVHKQLGKMMRYDGVHYCGTEEK